MQVSEICQLLSAKIICGAEHASTNIERGYSSDLMSDVLTLDTDHLLLITGMCNLQTIRTAKMLVIVSLCLFATKK